MSSSRKILLIAAAYSLAACGGGADTKTDEVATDRPAFKWTDVGVSNHYLPLGNIVDRTPAFVWPAYTDNGARATEYNFGHQATNGRGWKEYIIPAAGAGCATGNSCSYTPSNHVFRVGDRKAWWVRGKINGRWKEWSSSHVFNVVTTPPPQGGAYQPAGATPTTNPVFKWPKVGSNTRYQLGVESQNGSGWKSYNFNCTTSTCEATPNYGFSVGNRMTWWVRPAGGTWSDRVDFTVTGTGGGDTQAPTVPASLRRTGATSSTASIRWNASTDNVGVTGYRVYRNGQQVGTSSNTTFTDSSLQSSTAYAYTVRAFDATNNVSGVSNAVSITTDSGGSTGGTINKRVSMGSDDAEEFASGGMYLNSSDLELTYSSSSQKVGIRFSGLSIPKNATINRAYIQFKTDERSSGNVPLVIQGHATNNAGTFTGARRNVSSRSKTSSSVAWSPADWNTRGEAGSRQRTPELMSIVQEITSRSGWNSGNAIAFIITSNSRRKRVAEAFEGDRAGAPLLHIEYTAGNGGGDTQAPTVPSGLAQVNAVHNRVSIRWTASTDNTAVTGYRIYRNGAQIGTSTSTTFNDVNVLPTRTYSYTVRAFDAANNVSAISRALSVTTPVAPDTQAPTVPANVQRVSATHNRAAIRWTASTDNKAVTGYRVYRNGTQVGTATTTTFNDATVQPATTYSYTVRAFDAANNVSAASSALSVTTPAAPDTQAPTVPSNVQRVSATHNRVAIRWTASTDNKAVTGYRVYRNGAQIGTATTTTFSDTTVQATTTYSYTVRAFDAANNVSAASTALSVVTPAAPDTQAPTAPTGLVKNKVKAESVSMKWNASTDNRAVTGYNVYRNGVLLKTVTELKHKDKTVNPGTTYTYTVKAFDAVNNLSAVSNALVVTTPVPGSTGIDEPAGIYNQPLDVLEVKVKILPPTGNTCVIDDYDGCTFGKVLQDINWRDEFKPEVKAVFTTANGFTANAEVRQRGGWTRLNPIKSFRVKLDKNGPKWNGERRIQLIKTFDDPIRMKHKISYDLFTEINKLPSMRARYVRLTVEDKGQFNFAENPSYTPLGSYKETDMGLYLQVEYFGKEYLERRNWLEDSRVYKPDHFDFKWHTSAYALDADGKPINKDAFEAQLEIKSGKDHRPFVEMIQAVNNTSNDFSQVFDTYFDRENYINWLAVNILSNDWDSVQHNFYLYNPKGTKKFYWVPWDYDQAYNIDVTDANGNIIDTPPKPPFWYTHGFRWEHPMHRRFLEIAGNAEALKQKVTELRNTVFTNSNIRSKLQSYVAIRPFVTNQPDNLWQYYWQATQAGRNAEFTRRLNELVANVADNYSKFLQYFDSPMPFWINRASQSAGLFRANWDDSVSLQGHVLRYDLSISSTPEFKAGTIVRTVTGLTNTTYTSQLNLPSGKYYVKVISKNANNATKWQAATNEFGINAPTGEYLYGIVGIVEMIVP